VLKTAVLSRVRVEGGGGTSDQTTEFFSTITKIKVKKHISFFTGHEVLYIETTFPRPR
jgi:hypothetical protein